MEANFAPAQHYFATLYESGRGVRRDLRKAAKWYRTAAQQADAVAENNIGYMYFTGSGVPLDYAEAFKWFLESAKQGFAQGEANLGIAYATGRGTRLDYVQAYVWLNLAAAEGDSAAVQGLKKLREIMTPSQASEAERRVLMSAVR